MTKHMWLIVGLVVSITVMGACADAGVIFPINPQTRVPDVTSPVTVSLFNGSGQDITDTWLPTWKPGGVAPIYVSFNAGGQTVTGVTLVPALQVVLNGTVNPFLAAPMTTSAYPGRCTNFDDTPVPHTGADYTFNNSAVAIPGTQPQRQGYQLTSEDCGGMAVITATVGNVSYRFVLPQDSNFNGIPDVFEAQRCPLNSCPTGQEDADAGPILNSPTGDGIAAFDEYRGFIVSGEHVPTDPRQRDLFIHLVTAECGGTSHLFSGTAQIYPSDGTGLLDNLATLVPGTQVHRLGFPPSANTKVTNEWVDRFVRYREVGGFDYTNGTTETKTPPADDRRINKYAVFPRGVANPGGTPIQKGLRLTECDDPALGSLGNSGLGTTNGPDNSLLYTQRIINKISEMIANGAGRTLRVFTLVQGTWVQQFDASGVGASEDFVISQVMKYVAPHELTHSTRLTPTVEGDRRTSYGYHHAPGTGSVMDQTITQKIDKATTGFNSFYIPSVYNGADQSSYKITD